MSFAARALRVGAAALAVVALIAASVPAALAAADTVEERRQAQDRNHAQRQELASDLADLTAEEQALLAQLETARAADAHAAGVVASLDANLADAVTRLAQAEALVTERETALEAAGLALGDATVEADAAARALRRHAVGAYVHSQTRQAVNQLLEASNVRELSAYEGYAEVVAHRERTLVDRHRAAQAHVGRLTAEHRVARDQATASRDAVAAEQAALAVQRIQAVAARSSQQNTHAELERVLARVATRRAAYEAQIAALAQANAEIEAGLRAIRSAQAHDPNSAPPAFRLTVPIVGAELTSPFGHRVHPIYGIARLHAGVDYVAPRGTLVGVAGDGRVLSAGAMTGYGNTVIIDHGGGLTTLYAHLDSISVSPGQALTAGHPVGTLGNTGASTAPHLHFETRMDGTPLDPRRFLP